MNRWYENRGIDDDIVIASRVTLSRNLYNYDYAPKISDGDSLKLLDEVAAAFYNNDESFMKMYKFIRLDTIQKHQRAYWVQRRVVDDSALAPQRPQAVIISENESVSLWINGDDHLKIQAILRGRQIGRAYELVRYIDELLNRKLTYAYSRKYGHLTTAAADLGTGLHVSYIMRLPATQQSGLTGSINERLLQSGFTIRLDQDFSAGDAGNAYEIYNKKTLGVSEAGILDLADGFAEQLVLQERELWAGRREEDQFDRMDDAYKAYGILKYARRLSMADAMECLVCLEQGISDKTIHLKEKTDSGASIDLFPLMIEIQPESLAHAAGCRLGDRETDVVRAAYIQERLPELEQ